MNMRLVALHDGPLFFNSVPSLNGDLCEPFALKIILITGCKIFVFVVRESMLKMHLSMKKIK